MNEIKERPILFSGEMVKAILEGRKTQARRVVKPQPPEKVATGSPVVSVDPPGSHWALKGYEDHWGVRGADGIASSWSVRCPFGRAGDQLWVRETHCFVADGPLAIRPGVAYAADNQIAWCDTLPDGVTVYNADRLDVWKWRPSIFMPKWASRISLRITDVRLERLQDISHHDILAEGVGDVYKAPELMFPMFAQLWGSINEKRGHGWGVNPWVWVVEFRRIEQ